MCRDLHSAIETVDEMRGDDRDQGDWCEQLAGKEEVEESLLLDFAATNVIPRDEDVPEEDCGKASKHQEGCTGIEHVCSKGSGEEGTVFIVLVFWFKRVDGYLLIMCWVVRDDQHRR